MKRTPNDRRTETSERSDRKGACHVTAVNRRDSQDSRATSTARPERNAPSALLLLKRKVTVACVTHKPLLGRSSTMKQNLYWFLLIVRSSTLYGLGFFASFNKRERFTSHRDISGEGGLPCALVHRQWFVQLFGSFWEAFQLMDFMREESTFRSSKRGLQRWCSRISGSNAELKWMQRESGSRPFTTKHRF